MLPRGKVINTKQPGSSYRNYNMKNKQICLQSSLLFDFCHFLTPDLEECVEDKLLKSHIQLCVPSTCQLKTRTWLL